MAETWFTTLRAIHAGDPDWEAIAAYREPIARFLARFYPRVPPDLRDDVTQEVLCALRTSVVARFDPDRGRFRDLLRGVIQNQLRRALAGRRARPAIDADALPAAPADAMEAVDLGARLIRAVRRLHDQLLRGDATDREVIYCMADRLIDGLSYAEIAAKEGLSAAAVKRRLQTARRGVLRALLVTALGERGLELGPRRLNRLAEQVAAAIASRRPPEEHVKPGAAEPAAREVALALVATMRAGVRWMPGLDSPDGQAFVSALREVLEPGSVSS